MRTFRLALNLLRRDLAAGELTLLAVALLIAIVSLTSVGFFTDRLRQGLQRDANQLLGGDVLLVSDRPLAPAFRQEAERGGLQVTDTLVFTSMATTADGAQLATLKAVQEGYPLRGSLRIAPAPGSPGSEAGRVPTRGEVWAEARLLTALSLKPGDTLQLGERSFRIGAVLTYESDRGSNFLNFVPRLVMNLADVPETGLLQDGSRARFRLQVAGESEAVEAFERWASARLVRGVRMESLENARPELRNNLDRAQRFLQLAAMLAVVLAAVAVGLSSRRYLQRHLDGCAVMRCFGAQRGQLLGMYGTAFGLLALGLAALGALLGYLTQSALAGMAASLVAAELPPPHFTPALHGLLVGIVLTIGFVLPQLLQLVRVPPIRVLRREWGGPQLAAGSAWALGAVLLAGLMFWVANDLKLGGAVVGGFALSCLIFALVARALLALLARLRAGGAGWGMRYGLAAMHRRLASSMVQVVGLALGLAAVLLLTLVTRDLLSTWQKNQAPDAPNQFVLNVLPDQRSAFADFFRQGGIQAPQLLPMVRGRLMSINGRAVSARDYTEDRARNLVERETNLSWASDLQAGNTITAGQWHGTRQEAGFSMEEGIGKTLGIVLGDTLVFDVGGQKVSGKVTSLRRLDWDSMRVNFFFIASPGLLDNYPATYITSFKLPEGQGSFINRLIQTFPNLTAIDVGAILAQILEITEKLVSAINFVFAFAVGAGIIVLLAALQATNDERMYELSVLRTLGARNSQLRSAMLAEFAVLGGVAAMLAVVAALAIGYLVSYYVLELPYRANWPALGFFLIAASTTVIAAGWLGVRGLLNRSVLEGLRTNS